MTRPRLRDLGITIGHLPPGPHNAITDVLGVLVGHRTLIYDRPRIARTGVTMVVPLGGDIWREHVFAGSYSFNGNGEMTGLLWLEESGLLTTPIGLTNTHAVGVVRDALVAWGVQRQQLRSFLLPVVAETYDGYLSDIDAFHGTQQHAFEALQSAASGPVAEGNVGGGTGMRCHGFKGGIGTSSRVVASQSGAFTVGVLVQANYGRLAHLRVAGFPVGLDLQRAWTPPAEAKGSIIVLIGTDAPLLPTQCCRLARRAAVGLGRVGGMGHNYSGDLFLAFATGNRLPAHPPGPVELRMLPHDHLDPFFDAVVEAVEEAILNALTAAETMTGFQGTAHALPLDDVQRIVGRYQAARQT